MVNTWVVKAQTSPDKFLGSSVKVMDVANKQGRERPFNYATAVNQFRGWIYAAVTMNARAIAATPLRLYTRKRGGKKLYATRSVRKSNGNRWRFLMGETRRHPSSGVIRKTSEWGGEFEEVVEQHPLLQLLSNPNPSSRGYEFACMRHIMGSLTGNTFLHPVVESVRSSEGRLNRVSQLWLMPSQWVKIVMADPSSGDLVAGYNYGVIATQMKFYPADEVFHMKFPNPRDMAYGLGPMEADWDAQKITIAQRETDQSRYDNLSRPDLAVITKSASNVTNIGQMKELQEEWARLFRGTFRQGSPVFLTGDTQVIPLNWMPTEQGDREIIVEEHAAVFGVPVSMLKANDPNLASAQVGFASWRENTILPYCRMDEEFWNHCLLPAFGLEEDAFLCYDDPVPENRDEVRQDIVAMVGAGVWTRNEARAKLGDEEVDEENADKLLVPSGLQPIDMVGTMPALGGFSIGDSRATDRESTDKPSSGSDAGSQRGTGDVEGGGNEGGEKRVDPADVQGRDVSGKWGLAGNADRHIDDCVLSQLDAHSHHEVKGDAADTVREGERETPILQMTKALNRVFALQRRDVIAALTGEKTLNPDLARILEIVRSYDTDVAQALAPFMELQLVAGGAAGLEAIQLPPDTFTVMNPNVGEFIRSYTVKLAGQVNDYTQQILSRTLGEGLDNGESTGKLAQRVNEVYTDFDGYRSEMIARTESARAYSAGTEAAWKESGMVKGKKWELANAACPVCSVIARAHADAIPLDQPFFPLGAAIPLPGGKVFKVDYSAIMGPPGHPHCRCGLTAVLTEEN